MPRKPDADGAPPIPHADLGSWAKLYPTLGGYMVDPVWPDGSTRKPGKLFISLENASWVVTLKEPSLGYILRAVSELPEEMFPALEALLRAPKTPWMVDPWETGRGKSRRK